ncbi:MAG: heparinase II/III family protein [Rhizobiaceae bacterium]
MAVSTGRKYRAVKRTLRSGFTILTGYSPFVPTHLVIAPPDLKTADSSLVEEYYNGRYTLAGKLVETKGVDPFTLRNSDAGWLQELNNFGWLRNLSKNSDQLSSNHAKAMVRDWMELDKTTSGKTIWEIEVASKRLIAWLQHSILILAAPDHTFHQDFMHSLGTHARFLKRYAANATEGCPKLLAYLALAYASICFSGHASSLKFARDKLDQELDLQIFADGSHSSRNPEAIVSILSYLLPYRQACIAAGIAPSKAVISSSERMLLALRFFRLGDGGLARFNGSGVTRSDLVATLLRYDESAILEPNNSSTGGYERLQSGDTILMMDSGHPPKGELSTLAHAGCLSFEFSSGNECFVVNSGAPPYHGEGLPALWRSTAAHSTAVIYETSSCKFENSGQSNNLLDGEMFSGSLKTESSRTEDSQQETVIAHHHGYVREFGARHQRTITLYKEAPRIEGNDWFSGPDKGDLYYTTKDATTLHFHLHPGIEPQIEEDGTAVILQSRSGRTWRFSCDEVKPVIEESVYFASLSGRSKTKQITLRFHACKLAEINWSFTAINS